jgi:UDP-2,3-diacylglucosamine hydrolase
MDRKKGNIVFASDFHLGIDCNRTSKERELIICDWMDSIKETTKELYLLGDIFDYWYEYKRTIPRGFSDFLAKLKELQKLGIKIHFFTGNHDMWMFDYFTKEYGIKVHKQPIQLNLDNKKFFIGHGDGLGPGDHVYKVIKKIFSNRICQILFSIIHPTLALQLMKKLSQRDAKKYTRPQAYEPDKEWLITFAKEKNLETHSDFYIFGHRHIVYDHKLSDGARVLNLGDWISYFSYIEWDGTNLDVKFFKEPEKEVYI